MKNLLIGCFLATTAFEVSGQVCGSFQADALFIDHETIHIISSFPDVDYFSTYSYTGEFLWEIPFGSKVISWKRDKDRLFILSRVRNGSSYWITCVDPLCGTILWEKGILAPSLFVKEQDEMPLE